MDLYNYTRSDSCPEWMSRYFDTQGKFDFHLFMSDLLEGIDTAVQEVFRERSFIKNQGYLSRVTPNIKYSHKKCPNCTLANSTLRESQLFQQCTSCKVTTSQTKMGACLQLKWTNNMRFAEFPYFASVVKCLCAYAPWWQNSVNHKILFVSIKEC